MSKLRLALALVLTCLVPAALAQETPEVDHTACEEADAAPEPAHEHPEASPAVVGVDEQLGASIPSGLIFTDERARTLRLEDLLDRPTIVLPVYYTCPASCTVMLASLASGIGDIPLELGEQYRVLSLSFDPEDTQEDAVRSRTNYTKSVETEVGGDDWLFLTGDAENVRRFTDGVGYRFNQTGPRLFVHPNVLVVLSAEGTIIRYVYGPHFLPFDMGMALTEAEAGTPSLSIRKLLTYCFSYDPERKTYTFTALRWIIVLILVVLGVFLFFLLRRRKTDA